MNSTLTKAPLAPLLDHLFEQAERATSPAIAGITREERDRLMRSKTEYLDFYSRIKDLWLPVSRETGALLYQLAAAQTPATSSSSVRLSDSRRCTWQRHCATTVAAD